MDGGQARQRLTKAIDFFETRTLRDAKRYFRAHTQIRTRAIRAAGRQTTRSPRNQALPIYHGQPTRSRTICTRYGLCNAVNQLARTFNRLTEMHTTKAKHAERLTYRSCTERNNSGILRGRVIRNQPRQPEVDHGVSNFSWPRTNQLRVKGTVPDCALDSGERAASIQVRGEGGNIPL